MWKSIKLWFKRKNNHSKQIPNILDGGISRQKPLKSYYKYNQGLKGK